jgi:hypothetical protein
MSRLVKGGSDTIVLFRAPDYLAEATYHHRNY